MFCIACQKKREKLAKSHVIPNFIRKRIAGELDKQGHKRYKFNWIDRQDLPKQDLPKPNLMCQECDSKLGDLIENKMASLIMPPNVDDLEQWKSMPIEPFSLDEVFDSQFFVGKYRYPLAESELLRKFATSVAWRALHSMKLEDRKLSTQFLNSQRGKNIDGSVRRYVFENEDMTEILPAQLYYLGHNFANFLTDKDDEMPFGWAELGESEEILGVGVILGYWIILWPVFESKPIEYFDKLVRLEQICFINWVAEFRSQLN